MLQHWLADSNIRKKPLGQGHGLTIITSCVPVDIPAVKQVCSRVGFRYVPKSVSGQCVPDPGEHHRLVERMNKPTNGLTSIYLLLTVSNTGCRDSCSSIIAVVGGQARGTRPPTLYIFNVFVQGGPRYTIPHIHLCSYHQFDVTCGTRLLVIWAQGAIIQY